MKKMQEKSPTVLWPDQLPEECLYTTAAKFSEEVWDSTILAEEMPETLLPNKESYTDVLTIEDVILI